MIKLVYIFWSNIWRKVWNTILTLLIIYQMKHFYWLERLKYSWYCQTMIFGVCIVIQMYFRSSHLEVFLRKDALKICSKFTGEPPCRSAISIKLQSNFIEIALRHGCSPVNLLYIFRTPFPRNTPLDGCFWSATIIRISISMKH